MICFTGRSDINPPLFLRRAAISWRGELFRPLRLDVQGDSHLVVDENAAGFKRRIPGQAEVLAVDLRGRRDRNSRIAPGILRRRSWPFNVSDQPNACGLERQRRKFLNVKKSALFRCASRWGSRVSIEAASIEASTRELVRSDSSSVSAPVTLGNCPSRSRSSCA